ncbi:hypothetical protein DL93DRAFT_2054093, partial [Clavulina sp. PMI_390]
GHSMVPAVIPPGTLMFHGTHNQSTPVGPEWLAFDFEHSYGFARSITGHVLTFAAKRPLRVVLFDGLSGHVSRDMQEVIMFGEVREEVHKWPWETASELCAWGDKFGVDGFVRMEDDFELIWCDFDNGLELVSALRVLPLEQRVTRTNMTVSSPNADPLPLHSPPRELPDWPPPRITPPRGWVGTLPTSFGHDWYSSEIYVAAKWHDRPPGETRVRPIISKLVTFYDPAITSVIANRRGKTRDQHRLVGISGSDAETKRTELEEVLKGGWIESMSGVDWASIVRIVVEQYSERLDLLNQTLSAPSSLQSSSAISLPLEAETPFNRTFKARQQVLTMLTPHFTVSDTPLNVSTLEGKRRWLAPVIQRCSTRHTRILPTELFTEQERLIRNGVETVTREICRRLGRMFYLSYDLEVPMLPDMKSDPHPQGRHAVLMVSMRMEIQELMEWLDWVQVWSKCRPACRFDVSIPALSCGR